MKMTKEQKYRLIEQAEPGEIASLQKKVEQCPWRQSFHIQPPTGLLNDPNGFSYYQGEYHLFYQWFPLGTDHGMKYWYHLKSKDLVTWHSTGIGITPGDYFDSHGAYSGSALEHEGKLYMMYTGNTRDENWIRHPYQCMAVMDESGHITKWKHPVIDHVPEGYTDHFRDPKLWKDGDSFYCVIGAQRTDSTGCVVLYRSTDLHTWQFEGELSTGLESFGYMWECPDYFELNGAGVLVFSPQGLEPSGDENHNIYQSGYVIGKLLDTETRTLEHGAFQELDRGFDFYAPQTMIDPQGRRIMVAWMGLPDIEYPTDPNGWAHCLTLPRELTLHEGKLLQRPIPELTSLRRNSEDRVADTLSSESKTYEGFKGTAYEMICEVDLLDAKAFGIEFRASETEKTVIKYNAVSRKLVLDRTQSGEPVATSYGEVRQCAWDKDHIKLHLFVDTSSVEIFVNDGEEVFTSRIFPHPESDEIRFFADKGDALFQAIKWNFT
ncbi:beta-fructofuranosidase [Paenibacillus jamilae]|jgi:beta-fructofuranosidase|uniref:glycoside hydrolase family 32 protein n=1 Tax=Paenibacillus polymyxa TaxID=1406 RepID=UPI001580B7BF|nr:sucrose-6-phosphate hydrolase [Paenibacillus polymyxa]MDP9678501.1 beta-fructofuranosidase [Paenibacillus jamilae]MBY0023160.1 sucrose-6-phosphate hydrolase [Paenibacillus polymyxa]MBY0059608.1 sucrose-6-phosphate hydrolase [Paenibacillus polymyxa]MBY0069310.1 sucrose-6-phosphate hydrolase [Paenibacillus polymyxa]MBY0080254.1 sucrose-6-phosphate hydrolase [Paenibacillus polymyxa]